MSLGDLTVYSKNKKRLTINTLTQELADAGNLLNCVRTLWYLLNPLMITDWPIDQGPSHREKLNELQPEILIQKAYVDLEGYQEYLKASQVDYPGTVANWHEKSLEHYMSLQLMGDLQKDDVLMDVASCYSPFGDAVERIIGCSVYRQDLCYPPGIREYEVGGNATDIPLPDNSLTGMTLHCSFEHFEQDSDSGFIVEASRVLRPGGKVCILPLYMLKNYYILTNPIYPGWTRRKFKERIKSNLDAEVIYKIGYKDADFVRFYSPTSLSNRVLELAKGVFETVIFEVMNVKKVHSSCYLEWAIVLTKK